MRRILCSLLFVALVITANAQRSQLGIMGGVTYYIGDLNPAKQFYMVKPAGGIFYRYNINERMALRGSILYGGIKGDDAESTDTFRLRRNLSFQSMMLEFSGIFEFNFFRYIPGSPDYPITPYVFGGLSLFRFNPKANLGGTSYALQPLGTEGQGTTAYPDRKKYSLVNPALVFGIGLKFNVYHSLTMGLEWGMRRTFTDYLDDVSRTYPSLVDIAAENGPAAAALSDRSVDAGTNEGRQRGNSNNKDWFSFAGLSISFTIRGKDASCPAYPH